MQSLPSPQKVTPLEPRLASQITNVLRVKVKGTVSPFKRHMSVSVLGMINNAWNRLSISQGPASPRCCAELHQAWGGRERGDPWRLRAWLCFWLCWLLPWPPLGARDALPAAAGSLGERCLSVSPPLAQKSPLES